jgi:hypothetical protein
MKWHKSLDRLKIQALEREPEAEDNVVHAGNLGLTVGLKDVPRRPKPSDGPLKVLSEAPIERSHYERVYEMAITLRETSRSRRVQVDQDLDQTACS